MSHIVAIFSVENVFIAKVIWKDQQEIKYKGKYEKEKSRGMKYAEWCQSEISKMQEELQEEKIRGEKEVSKAQREGQERVKAITEQLMMRLTTSESRRTETESERRQILDQLAAEQAAAEERVTKLRDTLQKKHSEKEIELAALTHHYEEQREREKEKVMTFVLRLEERDQHALRVLAAEVEGEQLSELVQRLYTDHNIRLLGVDCGLSFLMEAPESQWMSVVERQLQIQATLNQLLPDDVRGEATWHDVTPLGFSDDDVDIRLGQPLPVHVEIDTQVTNVDMINNF